MSPPTPNWRRSRATSSPDVGAGRLAIRRALVAAGYEVHWSEPKTERSRRSLARDPVTLEVLRAHRARQAEEKIALGPDYEDHDLVFAREDGQPMHPERLSKLFGASVKAAGLPPIRLHDLRHTHATLALQAGVHPKIVSERLGHGDVGVTLNVYSHAILALEEDAAARVAALVFGA
jgi:integrase